MENKKKKDLAKMAVAALFLASSLPVGGNAALNETQGTYLAAGCSSKGGACGAAGKAGCGAAGKAGCGAAGKAGCGAAGKAGCGAASSSDYSSTKSPSGNYGSDTTNYHSNPNYQSNPSQGMNQGMYQQGQGMNPNMNPNSRGMNPGTNRPYNSNGNMDEYNYNSPNGNPTSDNYPTQPRGTGNTKNWSR